MNRKMVFVLLFAALIFGAFDVSAQQPAPASSNGQQASDPVPPRKPSELQEAEGLAGGAGNPECVWLGRRAVSLLWRDDVDIANRHINMYERFNCPSAHLKSAFRCMVRQGPMDPKQTESLNAKVHACWINTDLQPTENPQ